MRLWRATVHENGPFATKSRAEYKGLNPIFRADRMRLPPARDMKNGEPKDLTRGNMPVWW